MAGQVNWPGWRREFFGAAVIMVLAIGCAAAHADPLLITAQGLIDPQSAAYQGDERRMLADLRRDAQAQVLEKAIATMVSGRSVRRHYGLLRDELLENAERLVQRVVYQGEPTLGRDGFMHLLMRAEVDLGLVRSRLQTLSRDERIELIQARGDPAISTVVMVHDGGQGATLGGGSRSQIAENILKQRFARFGYRVWSHETGGGSRGVDFSVTGEVNFRSVRLPLAASGLEVTKYLLTSWTVKCTNERTGEEIYFNNKLPRRGSWASREAALREVGALIAEEFAESFFREQLASPTRRFQLDVHGLAEYDLGVRLEHELIGLRSVVNVAFRGFDAAAASSYEVEFSGGGQNFAQSFQDEVLKPLNAKLGERAFRLQGVQGNLLRVRFRSSRSTDDLMDRLQALPPASLADAPPARVRQVVNDRDTMRRVAIINPLSVAALAKEGDSDAESALEMLEGS